MPSDGEENDPVDWDLMDKFADDSMRLLQLNLVILTVFLSAIALNNQNIDTEYIDQFATSIYTLTAASLWVGSLLGALFVYRSARRTMLKDEYTNRIAYRDELVHINLIIASAGSSVFAVLIFITGIIDRSYSNGIPIYMIVVFLFGCFGIVGLIFAVLTQIDRVRDRP